MKVIIYISLIIGAWMLPITKGLREVSIQLVYAVANGAERFLFRGDQAEIRIIEGSDLEMTVNEPGRIVMVIIDKELTLASKREREVFEEQLKKLPSKVLIAKVAAEDNELVMNRLNIPKVPNIRIYSRGKMVEEFKGTIDVQELLKVTLSYVENEKHPGNRVRPGSGTIEPLKDDWLPEGIERAKSQPKNK